VTLYRIGALVRRPGESYTFGPHDGAVIEAGSYEDALHQLRELVEAEGWVFERPLGVEILKQKEDEGD